MTARTCKTNSMAKIPPMSDISGAEELGRHKNPCSLLVLCMLDTFAMTTSTLYFCPVRW